MSSALERLGLKPKAGGPVGPALAPQSTALERMGLKPKKALEDSLGAQPLPRRVPVDSDATRNTPRPAGAPESVTTKVEHAIGKALEQEVAFEGRAYQAVATPLERVMQAIDFGRRGIAGMGDEALSGRNPIIQKDRLLGLDLINERQRLGMGKPAAHPVMGMKIPFLEGGMDPETSWRRNVQRHVAETESTLIPEQRNRKESFTTPAHTVSTRSLLAGPATAADLFADPVLLTGVGGLTKAGRLYRAAKVDYEAATMAMNGARASQKWQKVLAASQAATAALGRMQSAQRIMAVEGTVGSEGRAALSFAGMTHPALAQDRVVAATQSIIQKTAMSRIGRGVSQHFQPPSRRVSPAIRARGRLVEAAGKVGRRESLRGTLDLANEYPKILAAVGGDHQRLDDALSLAVERSDRRFNRPLDWLTKDERAAFWSTEDKAIKKKLIERGTKAARAAMPARLSGGENSALSLLERRMKANAEKRRVLEGDEASGDRLSGSITPEEEGYFDAALHEERKRSARTSWDRADAETEDLTDEYLSKFGNDVSADNARELFWQYNKNKTTRSLHAASVHEAASTVTKRVYKRLLDQEPRTSSVLVTGGGPGSGKTSGLPEGIRERNDIVYDAASGKGTRKAVHQALKSGRSVDFWYTLRDPMESWAEGVLPRATKHGRTVPAALAAEAHSTGISNTRELLEAFDKELKNKTLTFHVVDNRHGLDEAKRYDDQAALDLLYDLEIPSKEKLYEAFVRETKQQYEAGRIPHRVYAGALLDPFVDVPDPATYRALSGAGKKAKGVGGAVSDGSRGTQQASSGGDTSGRLRHAARVDGIMAGLSSGDADELALRVVVARQLKPDFDRRLVEVARSVNGGALVADVKKATRAAKKVKADYTVDGVSDVGGIKDLLRGTIIVSHPEDIPKTIEALRQKFPGSFTVKRNMYEAGADASHYSGYRDVQINVDDGAGGLAEIQINIPEMLEAKGIGHTMYEEQQGITRAVKAAGGVATPEQKKKSLELEAKMASLYSGSFDEIQRRAASRVIPTPAPGLNTRSASIEKLLPPRWNPTEPQSNGILGSAATNSPSTSYHLASSGTSSGSTVDPYVRSRRDNVRARAALESVANPPAKSIPEVDPIVQKMRAMETASLAKSRAIVEPLPRSSEEIATAAFHSEQAAVEKNLQSLAVDEASAKQDLDRIVGWAQTREDLHALNHSVTVARRLYFRGVSPEVKARFGDYASRVVDRINLRNTAMFSETRDAGIPLAELSDPQSFMHHAATPELQKAILSWAEESGQISGPMGWREFTEKHGAQLTRKMRMTAVEANLLGRQGKLAVTGYKPVQNAFYTNPFVAQAYREQQGAQAIGYANHLRELAETYGHKIGSGPAPAGWKAVANNVEGIGDKVLFDPDVAEHLTRHFQALKAPGAAVEAYDRLNQIWKTYTLGIFPVYHTRNELSDLWNAVVLGGMDLRWAGPAMDELIHETRLAKRGSKSGVTFDDGRHFPVGDLRDEAESIGLLESSQLKQEIDQHVLGNLADPDAGGLPFAPAAKRIKRAVSEAGAGESGGRRLGSKIGAGLHAGQRQLTDNRVIATSLAIGNLREQALRLGLYIDRRSRGWAPESAGEWVRKHLIDYGQSSDFENEVVRRTFPFYMWTRHNAPLQLEYLFARPGAFGVVQRARLAAAGDQGLGTEDAPLPQFLSEGLPIRSGTTREGNDEFWRLEGTWPGADALLPLSPLTDPQAATRRAMSMLSPLPQELLEQATNSDWFRSLPGKNVPIEDFPGEQGAFLGMPMEKRLVHALGNARVLTELNRLNPGEVFGTTDTPAYGGRGSVRAYPDLDPGQRWTNLLIGRGYAVDPARNTNDWQRAVKHLLGVIAGDIKQNEAQGKTAQAAAARKRYQYLLDHPESVSPDMAK